MKTNRVLVVYGSETNQTRNALQEVVTGWKESKAELDFSVLDFLMGDDAAEKFSDINSSNYDFLIIATSSYGEGDPPSGFGKFFYQLQEASKSKDQPLKGLQHSILGFGSTVYETFQNIPRLSDKYLSEAGSRRCLKRVEIDDCDEEWEKSIEQWKNDIANCMSFKTSEGAAEKEAVCDWKEPCDQILKKTLGADGFEVGSAPSVDYVKILMAVAVGGLAYYWYTQTQVAEEAA